MICYTKQKDELKNIWLCVRRDYGIHRRNQKIKTARIKSILYTGIGIFFSRLINLLVCGGYDSILFLSSSPICSLLSLVLSFAIRESKTKIQIYTKNFRYDARYTDENKKTFTAGDDIFDNHFDIKARNEQDVIGRQVSFEKACKIFYITVQTGLSIYC